MKKFQELFGKKTYEELWDKSDDAIARVSTLSDIYDDVPDHLKDVCILQVEFHIIDDPRKAEALKWLDRER